MTPVLIIIIPTVPGTWWELNKYLLKMEIETPSKAVSSPFLEGCLGQGLPKLHALPGQCDGQDTAWA